MLSEVNKILFTYFHDLQAVITRLCFQASYHYLQVMKIGKQMHSKDGGRVNYFPFLSADYIQD